MTWTHGQHRQGNQSPFVDPERERPKNYQGQRNPNQRQQYRDNGHPEPQSNIAATFTQDGLQTFANIFSSAVEGAISKTLPGIVENVVDTKLQEIMNQARDEITRIMDDVLAKMAETVKQVAAHRSVPVSEHQEAKQTVPLSTDNTEPFGPQRKPSTLRYEKETAAVIDLLKAAGEPVLAHEIHTRTKGIINWGSNPTLLMNRLMSRSKGQIVRVGRGVYEYRRQGN